MEQRSPVVHSPIVSSVREAYFPFCNVIARAFPELNEGGVRHLTFKLSLLGGGSCKTVTGKTKVKMRATLREFFILD